MSPLPFVFVLDFLRQNEYIGDAGPLRRLFVTTPFPSPASIASAREFGPDGKSPAPSDQGGHGKSQYSVLLSRIKHVDPISILALDMQCPVSPAIFQSQLFLLQAKSSRGAGEKVKSGSVSRKIKGTRVRKR